MAWRRAVQRAVTIPALAKLIGVEGGETVVGVEIDQVRNQIVLITMGASLPRIADGAAPWLASVVGLDDDGRTVRITRMQPLGPPTSAAWLPKLDEADGGRRGD